jgi:hypothetical protein
VEEGDRMNHNWVYIGTDKECMRFCCSNTGCELKMELNSDIFKKVIPSSAGFFEALFEFNQPDNTKPIHWGPMSAFRKGQPVPECPFEGLK